MLGAVFAFASPAPLSAGLRRCTPARTRLTRVGVFHHGGQVPPLVYVHGHEDRVFADYVAGLAGVHGVHLVSAIGACGRKSQGSLSGIRKSCLAWRLEAKRKS